MKIILVNQFYPPDLAPTGTMLQDLARTLCTRGHEVQVICSNRSYNTDNVYSIHETRDGVRIGRARTTGFGRATALGRLVDYGTFVFMCAWRLLIVQPRPHLILAMTTPPHLGALVRIAAILRRSSHVHWIMDLYPDVMIAHGILKPNAMVTRCLSALTRFALRGSSATITIGPDMAHRLDAYTEDKTSWIPLWGKDDFFSAPAPELIRAYRAERGWQEKDIIFMYSGNMGRGHRVHEFLTVAKRLKDRPRLRWVFCGDGSRRTEVEAFSAQNPTVPIELLPYAPAHRLHEHLCAADVHLVSLASEWIGCMVPSKFQGAFASGRPVIFVGGEASSLAYWIRDAQAGWVVSEGDCDALANAIDEASDATIRHTRGERAAAYARQHFHGPTNTALLVDQLEACLRE